MPSVLEREINPVYIEQFLKTGDHQNVQLPSDYSTAGQKRTQSVCLLGPGQSSQYSPMASWENISLAWQCFKADGHPQTLWGSGGSQKGPADSFASSQLHFSANREKIGRLNSGILPVEQPAPSIPAALPVSAATGWKESRYGAGCSCTSMGN